MSQLGASFRAHVLQTSIPGCTIEQLDDEHIQLKTEHALGAVNFYDFGEGLPEVVELSIVDPDVPDEPKFFLHFELDDEDRAEELFSEMTDELQQDERYRTTRVLLCCTAGLTTTMFANKLQEAAKTLSLDYSFEALPLAQAQEEGGAYDAVLLAPQVGYQRKAVAESFPDAAVVQIPAKVFASYDAGACLKMVMHLVDDNTMVPAGEDGELKLVRDLANDKCIMIIICTQSPRNGWFGWRIYKKGAMVARGSVTKRFPSWRDIDDILATLHVQGWQISGLDAIGIAVPGVVNDGVVAFSGHSGLENYDLGKSISERYGVKVYVENSANASAVGCYVSQDTYDSVVLHTQQTGHLAGGQGIVVDGHLLRGRINYAGQLGPLYRAFYGPERDFERAWTPDGMCEIVARTLVADITLVAPEAIYVAVDLVYDMDALRIEIARYFGDEKGFIPDMFRVENNRELVALGMMALCLQKMQHHRHKGKA